MLYNCAVCSLHVHLVHMWVESTLLIAQFLAQFLAVARCPAAAQLVPNAARGTDDGVSSSSSRYEVWGTGR